MCCPRVECSGGYWTMRVECSKRCWAFLQKGQILREVGITKRDGFKNIIRTCWWERFYSSCTEDLFCYVIIARTVSPFRCLPRSLGSSAIPTILLFRPLLGQRTEWQNISTRPLKSNCGNSVISLLWYPLFVHFADFRVCCREKSLQFSASSYDAGTYSD